MFLRALVIAAIVAASSAAHAQVRVVSSQKVTVVSDRIDTYPDTRLRVWGA